NYIIDAVGAAPFVPEDPTPINIPSATVDSYGTSQNDKDADPLEMTYTLDMASYNNPTLWAVVMGTGGSAANAFSGVEADEVAMNKVVDILVETTNFKKCL